MTVPTLVFLHALGASAGEWALVADHLPELDCVALDLPGFGDAAGAGYADVAAMADWLADEIRARALTACVLVGHSMGGKIVTLVAARASAGEVGLSGVLGVVLVTASPPAPEPTDEDRRAEMIGWFGDGPPSRDNAATFVDANTAAPLPDALRERAIRDVLRSSGEAWRGWLERGSREDWSAVAGQIPIPAMIIAGVADGDLNVDAQRRHNLPHYSTADVRVVDDAAHLIPYEQPEALATLIAEHAAAVAGAMLPADFARILGSDRVGMRTRAAMLDRMRPPPPATDAWTQDQHDGVATLIAHVLPDCGADLDLAHRILDGIAHGGGDGWRFAALPSDAEAWRRGIATLDALSGGFSALDRNGQGDWLDRIASGTAGVADDPAYLSPEQMTLWFEDVRAEIVRTWIALPATMAAIGYDGFAVGGNGRRKQGYTNTRADDPEAWQDRSGDRS
jgi:pimeloyl-ACP methyl ester carboxylesterase